MKIEITTPTNIAITIDTGNTNSLNSLRDAIAKALELEGYTKEDIDEVFNRERAEKKGNGLEVLTSMADISETQEHKDLVNQIINGPKVEAQGTLTDDGKYFYPTTDYGSLSKDCKHHKHNVSCYGQTVKIGSYACTKCIFNQGVDAEADWIKCSKIKEVLGEESK